MAGDGEMDAVMEVLGWRGRYTMLQVAMASLAVFPCAMTMLSIVFVAKPVGHRCAEPTASFSSNGHDFHPLNRSLDYKECSISHNVSTEPIVTICLHGYEYDNDRKTSLVSEWDLVCGRGALVDLLQTLLAGGTMVGALVFPALADRFGRKPVYLVCNLLLLLTGVAAALVPDYVIFAVLRFLMGAFQQGTGLCSAILGMEALTTRRRSFTSVLGSFLWPAAILLMVPLAFLMQNCNWRFLQLAITTSSLYCLALYWLSDESLRWLAANGKTEQLEKLLKKAAKMNGVDEEKVMEVYRERVLPRASRRLVPRRLLHAPRPHRTSRSEAGDVIRSNLRAEHRELRPHDDDDDETEDELLDVGLTTPRCSMLDIFKNRQLLTTSCLSCIIWMVNSLTYYGLHLTSGSLAQDLYLGFLLNTLVELPSAVAFLFLVDRLGRRRSTILFQALAGVALIASVLVAELTGPDGKIASTSLALFGKFSISTSFALVFLYTPELFPTNLRNLGIGVSSMAARIGGMAAPYTNSLGRTASWGPGVLFGCCCLLATLLVPLLPETKGRELPQRLEDVTSWRQQDTRRPRNSS